MKIDEKIDKHLNEKMGKGLTHTQLKEIIRYSKLAMGFAESMKRNLKDLESNDLKTIGRLKLNLKKCLNDIGLG